MFSWAKDVVASFAAAVGGDRVNTAHIVQHKIKKRRAARDSKESRTHSIGRVHARSLDLLNY